MKKIGIALLGLGVVGGGTYEILNDMREIIKKNEGLDIEVKRILERNIDRCKQLGGDLSIVTQNIDDIVNDEQSGYNYFIKWFPEYACFSLADKNGNMEFGCDEFEIFLNDLIVIGNIYDNPELLGGNNND